MTTLKPISDIVIVKRDVGESTNHFGLIIPDSFAEKPNQGTILAAGPGAVNADGEREALQVQAGQRVLLADQAGFEVVVDKQETLITKEIAMIAIIHDDTEDRKGLERLEVLNNGVLFRFLDTTSGQQGKFTDRASASGIIISARRADQNNPRWGEVIAIGPDAAVSVGDYIFIEGGAWSPEITFAGESFWKTDDERIIMSTTDIDSTM